MELDKFIYIFKARENNLKNVSLTIPRNKITVFTGLSGSGKSSLAFDTIYAEGQRRYMESLSSYARQYVEQLKKPDVDSIYGLSPAISIDQKSVSASSRSTVGTLTEIYSYLRLLFSKIGIPYCPVHNIKVEAQSVEKIISEISSIALGTKYYILAPVADEKKGEFTKEFQRWMSAGIVKAKIDGKIVILRETLKLNKNKKHRVELVIDQLIADPKFDERVKAGVERALEFSDGLVAIEILKSSSKKNTKETAKTDKNVEQTESPLFKIFSIFSACPTCGFSFPELEPRHFSFNSPRGACEECSGLGYIYTNPDEKIKDECSSCNGKRLNTEILNVKIGSQNINDYCNLEVSDLFKGLEKIKLGKKNQLIAKPIIKEILSLLQYMSDVGVAYLSLGRPVATLSGGESQRIRLASQLGAGLIGVLYVLDEPSIGLHAADHEKLLNVVKKIRDRGNTILIVEHDEDTIKQADYIYDFGPEAGINGGHIVAHGVLKDFLKSKDSLTAQYLSKKKLVNAPKTKAITDEDLKDNKFLSIKKAYGNNLKNINFKIPLGLFSVVTGVSGSGKSSIVIDTLYKLVKNHFFKENLVPLPFDSIDGLNNLDSVIQINQKPIGRTPRSSVSTYIGLYSHIRALFTKLPDAQIRGFGLGHFSFNVKGGRCEHCLGQGLLKVEMSFLADVYVPCDKCQETRFQQDIKSIKYRGASISDVLGMTVSEALVFFSKHKLIHKKLSVLDQVGLGYIRLGQSSTTLSGGEAQRVKLAKELSKIHAGHVLYILDEPTTGLHFEDVRKLLELLIKLRDKGNTILVIEHNLDVISGADYLVELGPGGGRAGGEIIFEGPLALCEKSKTSVIKNYLN